MLLAPLLFALLSAGTISPHANSISVSRIEVTETLLLHELELQTLSILEVLPGLDQNEDGELDAKELEQSGAELGAYLDANFALFVGTPPVGPVETRTSNIHESAAGDPDSAFALQRIALTREVALNELPSALSIEVSVFRETSPDHRDFCTLAFEGQFEEEWLFSPEKSLWEYTPDAELTTDIFWAFAESGSLRLIDFESCALLLLLLIACPNFGAARSVLLAYLVGVSAGAALSTFSGELLTSRILDLTLILAVPYSAAENAMQREPRTPRVEALLFGLVLGVSLVQSLTANLVELPQTASAIAGHALGFFGALVVLVAVLLLVLPKLGGTRVHPGSLAPDWLRRRGSWVLALIGLALFVRSAWFLNA